MPSYCFHWRLRLPSHPNFEKETWDQYKRLRVPSWEWMWTEMVPSQREKCWLQTSSHQRRWRGGGREGGRELGLTVLVWHKYFSSSFSPLVWRLLFVSVQESMLLSVEPVRVQNRGNFFLTPIVYRLKLFLIWEMWMATERLIWMSLLVRI